MSLSLFLSAAALLILGVLLAYAEPRRLLPGLLLVPGLALTALGLVELMLSQATANIRQYAWLLVGLLGLAALLIGLLGLFLIVNAWTVARRERLSLPALVSGFLGLAILAYVVLSVVAVVRESFDLVVWLLFIGLPAGYFGYVFASYLLYSGLYVVRTKRIRRPVDAVIVLGSGLGGGIRVTPLLAARLDLGRKVFDRSRATGADPLLITSGGQGPDEQLPEAEAMANYLVEQGMEQEQVVQEDKSTDTRENLRFSKEILEQHGRKGEVAVATNNFHAFRASLLMRELGIPGFAVGARTAPYYWPSAMVREFLAVMWDHIRLNVVVVGLLSIPLIVYIINTLRF